MKCIDEHLARDGELKSRPKATYLS
jgi:hypothetical protein